MWQNKIISFNNKKFIINSLCLPQIKPTKIIFHLPSKRIILHGRLAEIFKRILKNSYNYTEKNFTDIKKIIRFFVNNGILLYYNEIFTIQEVKEIHDLFKFTTRPGFKINTQKRELKIYKSLKRIHSDLPRYPAKIDKKLDFILYRKSSRIWNPHKKLKLSI